MNPNQFFTFGKVLSNRNHWSSGNVVAKSSPIAQISGQLREIKQKLMRICAKTLSVRHAAELSQVSQFLAILTNLQMALTITRLALEGNCDRVFE